MGMHKTCKIISGALVLVGGVAILLSSIGQLGAKTGGVIAGVGIGLYGVVKLSHALGLCPNCKDGCEHCGVEAPKKRR